ncbi:hypothetical protein BJY59DRAFT_692157 [Rhodotorula toruloides]
MAHTGQPVSISVHPDLRDDWTALVNAVELFISNDPGCREYTRTRAYALFPPPFVTPDWPAVQHALVTQFGAEQGDDQAGIETGVYGAAYIAGVLKKTLVPDDRLCMHAIKVWLRRFTNALESCNTRIVQPNKIASPTPSTRDAFAATAVALTATSSASYKVGESSSSLVRTPSNSSSTSSDSTDASQKGRNAESPTPFSTPESLDERTTRQARHASAPSPSPKPEVKLEDVALDPIVRPIATTRLLRPKTEELGPVPALNDGRRRSSRLTRSRSPSPDLEDTKACHSVVSTSNLTYTTELTAFRFPCACSEEATDRSSISVASAIAAVRSTPDVRRSVFRLRLERLSRPRWPRPRARRTPPQPSPGCSRLCLQAQVHSRTKGAGHVSRLLRQRLRGVAKLCRHLAEAQPLRTGHLRLRSTDRHSCRRGQAQTIHRGHRATASLGRRGQTAQTVQTR